MLSADTSAEMMRTPETTCTKRSHADRYAGIDALLDALAEEMRQEHAAAEEKIEREMEFARARALLPQMIEHARDGSLSVFWQAFEPKIKVVTDDISGPVLAFSTGQVDSAAVAEFFRPEQGRHAITYPMIVFQLTRDAARKGYHLRLPDYYAKSSDGSMTTISDADRLYRLDSVSLTNDQFNRLHSFTDIAFVLGAGTRVSYDNKRGLLYFDEGRTAALRQGARKLVGPFVDSTDLIVQPRARPHELVEVAQQCNLEPHTYDVRMGTIVFRDGLHRHPSILDEQALTATPTAGPQRYEQAWTRMMQAQRR